jgi:hypothetical protein
MMQQTPQLPNQIQQSHQIQQSNSQQQQQQSQPQFPIQQQQQRTHEQLRDAMQQNPMLFLPYPKTLEELQQIKFQTGIHETCIFKCAQGALIGGGAGAAFTLLMSVINVGMGSSAMLQPGMPGYVEPGSKQLTFKQMAQDFRAWRRVTGQSMRTSAKGFALFSGCYAATDCALERYRGRHDWMNAIAAGGIAGGICGVCCIMIEQDLGDRIE